MEREQDLVGNILTESEELPSGPACLVADHLPVWCNLGGGSGGKDAIYLSEISFSQL